jgi:DNA-binding NtrC family response regulator
MGRSRTLLRKHDPSLLIVDDDTNLLASWQRAFREDFSISTAANASEARQALSSNPDIILLDMRLDESDPTNQEGIELLEHFVRTFPDAPVVMISAWGDVETAVNCLKLGAVDFIEKSSSIQEIRQRLMQACKHAQAQRKVRRLEEYIQRLEPAEIIGNTAAIQDIRRTVKMVSEDGHITVLIQGETGTGKELVAKAIHRTGWRSGGPFVPVAIVSLAPTLIESELFGHEAGAFTGAKGRKHGWVEKANGGLLFLDEIGQLPLEVQTKLLRFLEEKKFVRVGSTSEMEIDAQVVAATNRDLEAAVKSGNFREDLYYRLKGFTITIPPLRDRADDIPELVEHFVDFFRQQGRTALSEISNEALNTLGEYHWPGNVRELRMALERAVLHADASGHTRIEVDDLPHEVAAQGTLISTKNAAQEIPESGLDLDLHLARAELAYIEEALRQADGRKTDAWKLLGLNDRFALRRRVNSILKKFPELVRDYQLVRELYGTKS